MSAAIYTEELHAIAGDARIFSGGIDEMFESLGERLTVCLSVDRINIWLFNETDHRIECIGNYSNSDKAFSKGEFLPMKDMPNYYSHLKSNQILVINDVMDSSITEEITEAYCKLHGITSMLDLPIHLQGELQGVVCYEHIGKPRKWTDEEIQFTLAANQFIALAMETFKRRSVQKEMEVAVREKELLLKEMHHRVKNNLSVLMSLLRMQGRESSDPYVTSVLRDCESRIFSMAKIHEHLYQSQNYLNVRLHSYLQQLVDEFKTSNIGSNDQIIFNCELDPVKIETSRAINLGLIVTEILNNITKHAFLIENGQPKTINIHLKSLVNSMMLRIEDNGSGFKVQKGKQNNMGLSLIEDLSEQIDAKLKLESGKTGTSFTLQFVA